MKAAVDVHYRPNGTARAAAVLFGAFTDPAPTAEYRLSIGPVAPYVPGRFFERELPCILHLLNRIEEPLDTVLIDGYAALGEHAGLGRHLWRALGRRTGVIGVAKSRFPGAEAVEVLRGAGHTPLYVTAVGVPAEAAARRIQAMHGPYRIPTLLKRADRLSRMPEVGSLQTGGK